MGETSPYRFIASCGLGGALRGSHWRILAETFAAIRHCANNTTIKYLIFYIFAIYTHTLLYVCSRTPRPFTN